MRFRWRRGPRVSVTETRVDGEELHPALAYLRLQNRALFFCGVFLGSQFPGSYKNIVEVPNFAKLLAGTGTGRYLSPNGGGPKEEISMNESRMLCMVCSAHTLR